MANFSRQRSVNCIAVEPGRWAETVEQLAGLSEAAIVTMRRNIAAMREPVLEYRGLAAGICRRLGIAELPTPA